MAFCSFCGRQLNDGEVCVCRQQAQPQPVQQPVQEQQTQFQQTFQPEGGFSPVMPPVKKKVNIGIIIGAVAAVAVIAAIILIVLLNRPKAKLYKSITNTFEDSGELMKTLGKVDVMGKSLSIDVAGEFNKYNFDVEMAYSGNDKQIRGKISGKKIDEFEAVLQLLKGEIRLAFPGTDYDKVIVYNYKDGDNEFIEDQVGSRTLEEINTAINMIYEASPSGSSTNDLKKIIKDWYNDLEIKKIDEKKKFKVDSEKRECGGYIIVVTPDNLLDLINKYVDYFEKNYADMLDQAGIEDLKEQMNLDRLEDQMEDAGNLEVACYLYSGKLAGIIITMEDEEEEVRINFEGGSYRMQNVNIEVSDDDDKREVFSLEGKTNGTKETIKTEIEGVAFECTYDKSTGDLKVSANESSSWGDYEIFTLKGNLEAKGSSLIFTVKDISADGRSVDMDDFTITISSSAKISKLKGTEFNVSEADEDDIKDELEDLQDALGDLIKLINDIY